MTQGFRASADKLGQALAKLRKSLFIKNLLIVMSGTALAQALGYALSPIISRLFSPTDFGIFGSFYAVVGVIAAGLTLDYHVAIVLPKNRDDAINCFVLTCLSVCGISSLCLIICVLAPQFVQKLLRAPHPWMLSLLILSLLTSGFNQACQAWAVRVKAFKHTSASQVIRSISTNGTQVGLGFLKGGAPALISTAILGDFLATVNIARVAFRDLRASRNSIKRKRIWELAKEYRDFPMYSSSVNVLNSLSLGLPVILLSQYYGIAVAGFYAFALKVLSAPMGLIQSALRQVLYQKATEFYNEGGRLIILYVKFTAGLFVLILLPSIIIFIWAPQLFSWIFGTQWRTAGVFAQSLMLWQVFMFCNLPAGICGRIARMQRQMAIIDVILLAARTLVLYLGGMYLSASLTVALYSLVGAIVNAFFIFLIGFALSKQEGESSWAEILKRLKEGLR
jgi:O-antigen/teichoic acid export membrane protein